MFKPFASRIQLCRRGKPSGRYWLLPVLIALLTVSRPVIAADSGVPEAQIKAVYIYNFASFVRWPNNISSPPSEPFLICAVGNDEVSRLLPGVIKGESVGQKPLLFRQLGGADDPHDCRIIYFADYNDARSKAMVSELTAQPVLTVSPSSGFARNGGHIELSLKAKRVHPVINRSAADSGGLRISAQLYRLSTVIDREAAQ